MAKRIEGLDKALQYLDGSPFMKGTTPETLQPVLVGKMLAEVVFGSAGGNSLHFFELALEINKASKAFIIDDSDLVALKEAVENCGLQRGLKAQLQIALNVAIDVKAEGKEK